jgi:fructuronate reductase
VTTALSRRAGHGRPAAPVRIVHLGLGNFFRAHQAWYTEHASDAPQWGIAAVQGRGFELADAMREQGSLYTLVSRAAGGDLFEVISSVSRAERSQDHDSWLTHFASPEVRLVTITVTEAGYLRGADGGLDRDHEAVRSDLAILRGDRTAAVTTAPARLVAGLAARRKADGGPLTLVPCDNLPDNGGVAARVVRDLAEMLDPGLAAWIDDSVSTVTTMVDRITPRTAPADVAAVAAASGRGDACPVVTEPFHEWVLSGTFAAGRPRWEEAGATFTEDITPFEHRKLWLLNGAHSLMAYAGSIRGHDSVAEAVGDDAVRGWVEQWWSAATRYIGLPPESLSDYRTALLDRFANPRMRHLLGQIAADGSQKLPVRILPTLRAERAAGRTPEGAIMALAAWVCHLRGLGTPVDDVRAAELVPLATGPLPIAVRRVLAELDPELSTDDTVVEAVRTAAEELERQRTARRTTTTR